MAKGTKKVALVTGANKGIGREIARQLAADHGMTVLIGARDKSRGEVAASELRSAGDMDIHAIELDVTQQSTIEAAAKQIEREYGALDVLVNNAAIAIDQNPSTETDIQTFRETYETNVFGVFAVTQEMLPLLQRSGKGRIVNMSSGLASLTQNSDPSWEFAPYKFVAYSSSKTAVNAMTVLFADELKKSGIKINAADPGYVATDMNNHQGTRTVAEGATIAVRLATLSDDGPTGQYFDDNGPLPW